MIAETNTDEISGGLPGMREVFDRVEAQLQLTGDRWTARDYTMDVRLAWLSGQVGQVAGNSLCESGLLRVAAVIVAWLEAMQLSSAIVRTRLADAHRQQWRLIADKNIFYTADAPAPECRKLRALLKALGRVAQAVEGLEIAPRGAIARQQLMGELLQVAAVATVWLVDMDERTVEEMGEGENIQR